MTLFIHRFLAATPQPWAGLEIGHSYARCVVLTRAQRQWRIAQYHQWPLQPGWLQAGQVTDFSALAQALQQQLEGLGVRRLAMALPAEACRSQVVDPPVRSSRRRIRLWLQAQAAALMQLPVSDLSWSAHTLPGQPGRWRLLCAPLELVQDWLALAEAAGCELARLDEVHQCSWQALACWYRDAPPSLPLLQVGTGCVQALHRHEGQWHWLWRHQADEQELLAHCLQQAGGAGQLALLGDSELAQALQARLQAEGVQVVRPLPAADASWARDDRVADLSDGFWPALGLALPAAL